MTTCFEEGDPNARICIVGEAPGRTEVRAGRPLVGPAGQIFEQCLHEAGIARRQCYILNAFEFECVRTKTGDLVSKDGGWPIWSAKKGFSSDAKDELEKLYARLDRCGANVLVPLGGVPLSALFGDSRILKWRGSIISSDIDIGQRRKKLVPTIHPAATLPGRGQYIWRYLIIHDFKRALEESKSSAILLPQRELIIRPSKGVVLDFIKHVKANANKFATDIELYNHQVSCLSIAPDVKTSLCIPFLDDFGNHYWSESDEADIWLEYAKLMEDPRLAKINQNIIFDIHVLFYKNNILTRGPLCDTMAAQHILYPDFPKGLDMICSLWTREPYYKDEGKIWKKVHGEFDIETFWRYNAKDSVVAYEAWEELDKELDKQGYRISYDMCIEVYDSLRYMMARGVKVDKEHLEITKEKIQAKLKEKEKELEEVADYPFSPLSPKQCQEYFYAHKSIKPYINRKTGGVTTDDKALARIYKRYNLKEAKIAQEIRGLSKLLSTYFDVNLDVDSRLRCSYNPRGTSTGRLSSSETVFGTGLNMQNLHAEFKEFLVADME